jgi:hypothetical protein
VLIRPAAIARDHIEGNLQHFIGCRGRELRDFAGGESRLEVGQRNAAPYLTRNA